MRELEAFLRRAVRDELSQAGLGLRLRYLLGGATAATRLVQGKVIPERAGYYLGHRMTEALVQSAGIGKALRASGERFAWRKKPRLVSAPLSCWLLAAGCWLLGLQSSHVGQAQDNHQTARPHFRPGRC
jgi:hypothetical protein